MCLIKTKLAFGVSCTQKMEGLATMHLLKLTSSNMDSTPVSYLKHFDILQMTDIATIKKLLIFRQTFSKYFCCSKIRKSSFLISTDTLYTLMKLFLIK